MQKPFAKWSSAVRNKNWMNKWLKFGISILFQYLTYILAKFNTFSRSWKPISKLNTFSIPRGTPNVINFIYKQNKTWLQCSNLSAAWTRLLLTWNIFKKLQQRHCFRKVRQAIDLAHGSEHDGDALARTTSLTAFRSLNVGCEDKFPLVLKYRDTTNRFFLVSRSVRN